MAYLNAQSQHSLKWTEGIPENIRVGLNILHSR